MKKINFIFFNIIIIIFITAFFAFADEVKNAATPLAPASVKATSAAKQTSTQNPAPPAPVSVPTPPPAPPDNYSYNPLGKSDPFLPFIMVEILEKKKTEKKEKEAVFSIFPLQRAETDKYRVVGIVGDKDYRVAIAEDATKKFYPLLKGTRIGLHDGKVIEILGDRVIVEEYENKKAKKVILKLRKN
jgi:type IV pilus assembly protein PilP